MLYFDEKLLRRLQVNQITTENVYQNWSSIGSNFFLAPYCQLLLQKILMCILYIIY